MPKKLGSPLPHGRPITLPSPIGDLARAMGGVTALCEAMAVKTPSTIHAWAKGEYSPKPASKERLTELFKKHQITEGVPDFLARTSAVKPRGVKPLSKEEQQRRRQEGALLAKARFRADPILSQAQVALELGYTQTWVSAVEAGKVGITPELKAQWLGLCGLTMDGCGRL